ncbi:hypothetical protein GA0111570_103129 [Raineyella antarctica]|uniref:DUF5302 domain-containing protein n=1 Tax=Raineyella antarctica TaxID=1577474 RepID=A0A1G6GFP9_9ACTN|nr:DUF5302 domain-containing protein [Raineyella antarctica]SDB80807.1 hypothetical protein GA0111570_103129 [Raineyella antarctica]
MTTAETPDSGADTPVDPHALDPKEQMRAALEAKHAGHRANDAARNDQRNAQGGPHGQVGGKRQFRRKAGS